MTATTDRNTIDLPVGGMDCQSCAVHIRDAVGRLPGVERVDVLVSAERASVTYDPAQVTTGQIRQAVVGAGYTVREEAAADELREGRRDVRNIVGWGSLGLVALVVLLASLGERLGVLEGFLDRLPWWIPAAAITLGGWGVFRGVLRATLRRQITSHTLMTVGVIAAVAIGEWTTAALIVFFMRFADWMEERTTERNRQALRELTALTPATARVVRAGSEVEIPIGEVAVGDTVVVRPGERIPVDGTVREGTAPVDQAPVTGESVPVDKEPGDPIFAATVAQAGYLRIEATRVGSGTAFGRVVRLVEEAESRKAPVQRFADKFSTYYLPIVLGIAALAYLVTGQVLNAVAVLVVSCSCAIALATPVVVLASVGNGARRGLLIKGGIALEKLARVDTLVVDKTGTLTRGEPRVTDVVTLDGLREAELLRTAAAVESRSEHPLAKAIVLAASERGIDPPAVEAFTPLPGRGLLGMVSGREWAIGNRRLLAERGTALGADAEAHALGLEEAGRTAFFVADGSGAVAGIIGVADVLRPEAKAALGELKALGVRRMLLLTGDNERVAATVASELGIEYRADLLPEDKIEVVREL